MLLGLWGTGLVLGWVLDKIVLRRRRNRATREGLAILREMSPAEVATAIDLAEDWSDPIKTLAILRSVRPSQPGGATSRG